MRIVSSRHEPLVKNIRSGFKGKRERTVEEKERKRRENGERDHHAAASSTVFVHLRESHRFRFPSLPGRHTNEVNRSRQRESRGFPSEKYLLWFFELGTRTRYRLRETSAVYKLHWNTMHKSSKEMESRLGKRGLNGAGFDPLQGHQESVLSFFKLRSRKDSSLYSRTPFRLTRHYGLFERDRPSILGLENVI